MLFREILTNTTYPSPPSPLKTSLAPTVNQNLALLNIRYVADLHLSACGGEYVDTRNKRNTLTTPNIMKA